MAGDSRQQIASVTQLLHPDTAHTLLAPTLRQPFKHDCKQKPISFSNFSSIQPTIFLRMAQYEYDI